MCECVPCGVQHVCRAIAHSRQISAICAIAAYMSIHARMQHACAVCAVRVCVQCGVQHVCGPSIHVRMQHACDVCAVRALSCELKG